MNAISVKPYVWRIMALLFGGAVAGGILYAALGSPTLVSRKSLAIGDIRLTVEIAESPEARAKGLSGRAELSPSAGMLFVFEEEGHHGIWMKGMRFPIDIIWLDDNYRIVGTYSGAAPESHPRVFRPAEPARYVLEVEAGLAERHSLRPGMIARLESH